jgi:hypothetical protein
LIAERDFCGGADSVPDPLRLGDFTDMTLFVEFLTENRGIVSSILSQVSRGKALFPGLGMSFAFEFSRRT